MRAVLFVLICLFTFAGDAAVAVEEPSFKVEVQAGALEVRDYPGLVAAEVTVGGDRGAAGNQGFRLLAGYIFGGNTRKESLAMTAPVVMARAGGENIPMTAPVNQAGGPGGWVVRFIMPAGRGLESLPTPKDPRVRLVPVPPTRIAVARFSGLAGEGDIKRQTAELQAFIAARRLRATGAPSLSRYDPPWTPWFMRRNEIWIPVAG
jgi:hypothetical protein